MYRLNYKIISHIMGLLLLCNGGFMLIATGISFIYKDGVTLEIMMASLATMFIGIILMFLTREHQKEINKREGYIVVTFGWIFMSLSGTLPYLFSEQYHLLRMLFLKPCRDILPQVRLFLMK